MSDIAALSRVDRAWTVLDGVLDPEVPVVSVCDLGIVRDVVEMIGRGRHAKRLAVFPWEDHWTTPLTEVRRLLDLPENPRSIGGYTKGAFESAA